MENNHKKQDKPVEKPAIDWQTLELLKQQKEQALKTNQIVKKNEKDNH